MSSQFEKLGLQVQLLQAIEQLGYEQPTPIQLAAIPALLEGRNVVGQAQTGTGKTAAFVLPLLQQIRPGKGGIQALVLTPTRELAIQVAEAATGMARNTQTPCAGHLWWTVLPDTKATTCARCGCGCWHSWPFAGSDRSKSGGFESGTLPCIG